ncbi:MAG TPA: hypothetical protein VHP33_22915 [Polyangiaceae bacterium]|nr:hypothetical protein [Polyangiaceae bacterium]
MSELVPCPACDRHVRKHESLCPFCSAELSLAHLPPPAVPRTRLGRAATFAFGATLAGAALVACGGESEQGKKGSGGANAGGSGGSSAGSNTTAGSAMGGNIAQPYGVPPIGGNIAQPYGVPPIGGGGFGNESGSGGQSQAGSGGQNQAGTGQVPPYGAPPSEGGGTPIYGAAPAD